jgi:two-component system LytT family response regulator
LVHESLSSMAEKLKPYGFIRIHRSVVVNISAVEKIQPLPTGEYRLRVKGGKEYLVTRTYKRNLRDLAQLWVGSERLCS